LNSETIVKHEKDLADFAIFQQASQRNFEKMERNIQKNRENANENLTKCKNELDERLNELDKNQADNFD